MQRLALKVPRTPRLAAIQRSAGRATNEDSMCIDEQTLRDLEVFEGQDGAPSLFALLDWTRTLGGQRVLRQRFRNPFSSLGSIRATQRSIAHILEHRPLFNILPGAAMVEAVEEYLAANFSLSVADSSFAQAVDGFELRFASRKEYGRISRGVRRTARVLRCLERLANQPELAGVEGDLDALLVQVRTLLERPGFASLPDDGEGELPWWRILRLDRKLRGVERKTIETLLALVYELDALVAMADAGREFGFVLPVVRAGEPGVAAEAVFHPLLARPVANPLNVDQRRRLLLITGPNMAGKTTYLRACATAVYLAHLGMGVPARLFEFAPFRHIVTAISLSDSVRGDVSFFRAEALRVRQIAKALATDGAVFAVLDEPFKGTNVKDALDASRAVFTWFATEPGSVFLVSSHLIEVGPDVQATGCAVALNFHAVEHDRRLEFDFVLRPGISSQRLGMRVLEQEGVFELKRQAAERRTAISSSAVALRPPRKEIPAPDLSVEQVFDRFGGGDGAGAGHL